MKAKALALEGGVAAGGLTFAAGAAAFGSLSLATVEAKRALRGEKTTAAEAVDYYVDLVERGKERGGVVGFFQQTGGYVGGSLSALIAAGQATRADESAPKK
jgi:hypothetical protein